MHREGYLWLLFCVCVCVSVDPYSGTTGYKAAHERYQLLQNHANLKNKMAIFLKRLRSRDIPWKQKPVCCLNLIHSLCVPGRHKKSQQRACIDSRMLSTVLYWSTITYVPQPQAIKWCFSYSVWWVLFGTFMYFGSERNMWTVTKKLRQWTHATYIWALCPKIILHVHAIKKGKETSKLIILKW